MVKDNHLYGMVSSIVFLWVPHHYAWVQSDNWDDQGPHIDESNSYSKYQPASMSICRVLAAQLFDLVINNVWVSLIQHQAQWLWLQDLHCAAHCINGLSIILADCESTTRFWRLITGMGLFYVPKLDWFSSPVSLFPSQNQTHQPMDFQCPSAWPQSHCGSFCAAPWPWPCPRWPFRCPRHARRFPPWGLGTRGWKHLEAPRKGTKGQCY